MSRLVIISNRVPVSAAGAQAGGLAVALEALMSKRGGLWFGWSGTISPDQHKVSVTTVGRIDYATMDLSQSEFDGYYNRFANGFLWPLLHGMPENMQYDRADAESYRAVNARFADRLIELLQPSDTIWIHDYHFMALPALLRARGVLNRIGFFLHVPFVSADMMETAPGAADLIGGVLMSDLIGFQTSLDLDNFAASAQRLAGASLLSPDELYLAGHQTTLGVFPVEIDAREFAATAEQAWRMLPTERLRRSLGGQSLIIGVDRLDPTKGLLQRLAGYRKLFQTRPDWRRRVTLLQIAAVSRKDVASYQTLRTALDRESGSLNSDIGDPDWSPVRLVARATDRTVVAGYLRQAKVGLVTPLRDGMNLVAKEFVAAQDPQDPGVLVLSRFAGAARQLTAALLVNPHDPADVAGAIDTGLGMALSERQERWQAMWNVLQHATPLQWGLTFVASLVRTETRHGRRGELAVPVRRTVSVSRAPLSVIHGGVHGGMPVPGEPPRLMQ